MDVAAGSLPEGWKTSGGSASLGAFCQTGLVTWVMGSWRAKPCEACAGPRCAEATSRSKSPGTQMKQEGEVTRGVCEAARNQEGGAGSPGPDGPFSAPAMGPSGCWCWHRRRGFGLPPGGGPQPEQGEIIPSIVQERVTELSPHTHWACWERSKEQKMQKSLPSKS